MKNVRSPRAYPFSPGLRLFVFIGFGWLCLSSSALSQQANRGGASQFYPDFSDEADSLLRNAASHAREGQWGEAIDIYQRVVRQFGDKVARLRDEPGGAKAGQPASPSLLYIDVRQFCQRRIAALPPEARAIYRSRVDPEAGRWFRQGAANRDRALLRRVTFQAFCSSFGDEALELLGDLAFQDGRFEEALGAYRQLVPDRAGDTSGLVHPDPSIDLAKVAAKKLICRAAIGENPPAASDFEAFRTAFPDAKGQLAGRTTTYAEAVAEAIRDDRLSPPAQPDGRWPTFAGSPTRTRVVPGPVDVGSLQWRVDLDPIAPGHTSRSGRRGAVPVPIGQVPSERLLGYFPIVLGDTVVVANDRQINAYNLNDRPESLPGSPASVVKLAWQYDEDQGAFVPQATRQTVGVPRFTLTAFGDRIYARMGQTPVPAMGGRMGMSVPQNYVIAVERGPECKTLWKKMAGDVLPSKPQVDGGNRNLGFEGSPVADARRVYVAMTDRREQTATYAVCLDADTGATRWVRYLGAASADADPGFGFGMGMAMGPAPFSGDYGHRLLSLEGPTVYYQTNLGAVIAIDAETGSIRWVATYPRQERSNASGQRDLNPAIVHDGLVIVAPDDASAIYAFEAGGGRLAWKTDPLPAEVKLAHLLGVAKGRLVATGDRVLLFDVKNGKLLHTWPDNGHNLEGFGRGLLAGDKIYWPTHNEIHVLDQSTGLRTDPPIRLLDSFQTTGGNLAVGDGYLIVAQADRLVVFCQNRRLIQRFREEIARSPDQAIPHFQMARAAEATSQDELALESLDKALALAKPSDTVDGLPLASCAQDQKFRLLMRMGEKARGSGELAQAEERFHGAALAARSDRERLRAHLARADVQLDRGSAGQAVITLQALLAEERLRSINVAAEDGRRTIRSDLLVGDKLTAILKDHGRELYASFDAKAKALLETGKTSGDARQLEEVGRSYPVAAVVPESLLALGRLSESKKRPAEAARAYKRLLALSPDDGIRARALLGLAQAYKDQKLYVPARDAFTEALVRFPDVEVEVEDAGTTLRVATIAARKLEEPPFDRPAGDRSASTLPLPMIRLWRKSFNEAMRPIAAEGVPPWPEASRVFLTRNNRLRPVVLSSGDAPWEVDLGAPAVWLGFLDDRVLAATEQKVVALELSKGTKLWTFDAGTPAPGQTGPNPFARLDPLARPPGADEGKLHGFRIVGDRLFCLRGDGELLAVAGDSGQIDWSFTPLAGELNPNLSVGPQKVVLQTLRYSSGHIVAAALVVIDTATGRRLGEFPQAEGEDSKWERDPLSLDEDRLAIVTKRTVTLFDVTKGVYSWVFQESKEMPKYGPPRLFGDAERLLLVHDGTELIRLDTVTGKKRWSRPLGIENVSDRPEALAVDGERVYWVNGATLNGASLRDGALAWTRALAGPNYGWWVDLTERGVLAFPGVARRPGNELEGLPLVFCRRDTGDLLQRLLFPVTVADVSVRLAPRGAVVATQSGLWALGGRRAVDGLKGGR